MRNLVIYLFYSQLCIWFLLLVGCDSSDPVMPAPIDLLLISTDKAIYKPGEQITFTLAQSPESPINVRYKFLSEVIDENTITSTSWTWTPPPEDFKGYMTELSMTSGGTEKIIGTIGIDVSSDWKHFPRYGFLSNFSQLTGAEMDATIQKLTRHHINGIQFNDWGEKYHKPLAGSVNNPSPSWTDFSNQPAFRATVSGYINRAHQAGMKALFYNLINGALEDAETDGVNRKWYLFTDRFHEDKLIYGPGSNMKGPIYLINPTHTAWHEYLNTQIADVYAVYNFDGIHLDQLGQLGNLGEVYDFIGFPVDIDHGYYTSRLAFHWAHPDKKLVFNFADGFGLSGSISSAWLDFLYIEAGPHYEDYADLGDRVKLNNWAQGKSIKNVFAAYVNESLSDQPGFFNTSSVLFTDAVLFAFGASHIELGEHMLCADYFQNSNLEMKPDLGKRLISYYDFQTAYENVLMEEGEFNNGNLSPLDEKVKINAWPPQTGSVVCVGKELGHQQVFHLINFTNATTLQWRDNTGMQSKPEVITDFEVKFTSLEQAKKVWFASPDFEGGASREIDFNQDELKLSFKIPYLEYWSMIVVEY